ncbi:MAG: zinc ribbon domain-containing protein [Eubacteriales bacterium]|nr:zinc ribbon domain-containing protein [Eubacteriales bacterium]
MRLFCPKEQWLERSESYYRDVFDFYYRLLIQEEALWTKSIYTIQRELEILTVPGRDGRIPKYPLPYEKVPVYFRRSAINKAAEAVKSAVSVGCTNGFPIIHDASVTFFKGMYRGLSDTEITLKLWNGCKWEWVPCRLTGRDFPKHCNLLSPALVRQDKWYMLHIPVKQDNPDSRTAKERMRAGENICSIRFTNTDIFAMCCVLDENGRQQAVHTCRGGDAYRHYCRQLLEKIKKSRIYTEKDNSLQPEKKHFMHLKHLSEYYAHQVSREIVDFCTVEKAGIIVVPDYDIDFSRMVMYRTGSFTPLFLSQRIRRYLQYKAWSQGILVLEAGAEGISSHCAVCGGKVRKKGKLSLCENGHTGNRFLNDARNLGRKCQESFAGKGYCPGE